MPAPGESRGPVPALRATLAALLLVAGTGATEAGTEPVLEERVTTRLVRVPIVLQEKKSGDCQKLEDGSVEITEDGLSVGTTYLDPSSLDTVHAILVDAGPLMLESLREARRASATYVGALPKGEPALLATFDRRLLLRAPSSTDRRRFEESVSWIEVGAESSLWASTRKLIDYLRPRFARKALILVTRGCDTDAGGVPVEDTIAAAQQAEALSVFPIVIDAPSRCESTGTDPLPALLKLASRTGGELFRIQSATDLDPVFRAIGARLGREVFLLYEPPPFGAGPKDNPAKLTSRWRKLRATLQGQKTSCSLAFAGAALRCESAPGQGGCGSDPRGPNRLLRPFELSPSRDALNASVRDIVRDGGGVAPTIDTILAGDPVPGRESRDEERARSVSAPIPPLEETLRAPGVEGVIQRMLTSIDRSGDDAAEPAPPLSQRWLDEPFLVNGEVLFDLREPFSRALTGREDYLEWVTNRVREERLATFDALIGSARTEDQRSLLRLARSEVASGSITVDARETIDYLGGWLGDIPAAHAFQVGETLLARRLLAEVRTGGRSRLPTAWTEVERSWARFGRWVPPPQEVRMLGWLTPGYDPDERVVGWYRVILAQPFTAELKDLLFSGAESDALRTTGVAGTDQDTELFDHLQSFNFSREASLGARLLRWMLEQDELAALLLAGFDIEAVRYAHSTPRDLVPAMIRGGVIPGQAIEGARPARQVTLVLQSPGTSGPGLPIGAYFELRGSPRSYDREPLCLTLYAERAQNEAEAALLRALRSARRRTACLL